MQGDSPNRRLAFAPSMWYPEASVWSSSATEHAVRIWCKSGFFLPLPAVPKPPGWFWCYGAVRDVFLCCFLCLSYPIGMFFQITSRTNVSTYINIRQPGCSCLFHPWSASWTDCLSHCSWHRHCLGQADVERIIIAYVTKKSAAKAAARRSKAQEATPWKVGICAMRNL